MVKIRVSGVYRLLLSCLPWRRSVVELQGSVEASSYQQAVLEAELVLALRLILNDVSNAHLAGQCQRMLLFSV